MDTETLEVDITGLDKAVVLKALHDSSKAQGMGFLHDLGRPLTIQEAREAVANHDRFDYFHGRILKVDISGDSINPKLYDRDLGPGALAAAIDTIR